MDRQGLQLADSSSRPNSEEKSGLERQPLQPRFVQRFEGRVHKGTKDQVQIPGGDRGPRRTSREATGASQESGNQDGIRVTNG